MDDDEFFEPGAWGDIDDATQDAMLDAADEAVEHAPPFAHLAFEVSELMGVSEQAAFARAYDEAKIAADRVAVDSEMLEETLDAEENGEEPDLRYLVLAERLYDADASTWRELRRSGPTPELVRRANRALGRRPQRRRPAPPVVRPQRPRRCGGRPRGRTPRRSARRAAARAGPDDGGGEPEPGDAAGRYHTTHVDPGRFAAAIRKGVAAVIERHHLADAKTCGFCGVVLRRSRRADAQHCSNGSRADASRLRRLQAGHIVDGYRTVEEFLARRQRRTQRGQGR